MEPTINPMSLGLLGGGCLCALIFVAVTAGAAIYMMNKNKNAPPS